MPIVEIIFLLIALIWVLVCVFPGGSGPALTLPVLVRCVIGLLVLFVLYLVVTLLFGVASNVHAAAMSPFALAGAGFLLGAIDPVPPNPVPSTTGSGPSYALAWYIAWINAAVGIVCGVLAGAYLTVHPSWLSGDVAGTAGIIVPISVGLAALLPQVTRSPSSRETKYLAATQGVLPADLAKRFPVAVSDTAAAPLPPRG